MSKANMKWKIQLLKPALQDYADIIRWTRKKFGEKQAQIYKEILNTAIGALEDGPNILGAKKRDYIETGIHTLHVARHGRKGRHFLLLEHVYRLVQKTKQPQRNGIV